jgi:hypothetical protein
MASRFWHYLNRSYIGRVARWYLFSNKKSQFGYNLEGLGMVNVGILYGHLEYFMDDWYILG